MNWLRGERVELAALDLEADTRRYTAWARDSEYWRLVDTRPARAWTTAQARTELDDGLPQASALLFMIQALADGRRVGFVDMAAGAWTPGDVWLGIGIGARADWGRGYGAEALRLALRYAFDELDASRVSLTVFEYNPRAIRVYEKAGFAHEGRERGRLNRAGRRWDMLYLGLRRDEWQANGAARATS